MWVCFVLFWRGRFGGFDLFDLIWMIGERVCGDFGRVGSRIELLELYDFYFWWMDFYIYVVGIWEEFGGGCWI